MASFIKTPLEDPTPYSTPYMLSVDSPGPDSIAYRETEHLISPLGSDCGAYTSASLPVFFSP